MHCAQSCAELRAELRTLKPFLSWCASTTLYDTASIAHSESGGSGGGRRGGGGGGDGAPTVQHWWSLHPILPLHSDVCHPCLQQRPAPQNPLAHEPSISLSSRPWKH